MDINQALQVLNTFDWGGDRDALNAIDQAIQEAGHDTAKLAEIEAALLGVLKGKSPRPAQEFVCRRLALMGTDSALPELETLLLESETSDMARYALERMPGSAATRVLRNALPKTNGTIEIGIVDSLGQRGDRQACATLGAMLTGSDWNVVNAAANALGCIADDQATQFLAAAKDKAPAACRPRLLDAYLRCADALLARGEGAQAKRIYEELAGKKMPKAIQAAAHVGVQRVEAKGAAS